MLAGTVTAMVDYAPQFYPERVDDAMEKVTRMVNMYIEDHLRKSAEEVSPGNVIETADCTCTS